MVIVLFLLFIFYDKAKNETVYIRNNIFLQMQNHSLGLDDERFTTNTLLKKGDKKFYTLYEDKNTLYILAPISKESGKQEMMMVITPAGTITVPYSSKDTKMLKVSYLKSEYNQLISQMYYRLLFQFLLAVFGALIVSLLAAWYTLTPLRSSLRLLEDFIKDIIHDLNTPLSAILLNLKMIETKNEEIESIRTATQTIEMLHHNLDSYLKEQTQIEEVFSVDEIVNRYVAFFTPLYDYLSWNVELKKCLLTTDKQAFERIVYNLLSNACKYNTNDGKIEIALYGTILSIRNSSYGVKNPHKVFERFYKESERGLGIGLHIVDKLCLTLQIEKKFILEGTDVIVELDCKNIIA